MRFPGFYGEWEASELGKISSISKGVGISKEQRSAEGDPCILYGELYTTYTTEIIEEVCSKTDLDTNGLVKSKANDVIIPASGETAIDISTARCVTNNNVLLGGDLNIIRLNNHDGKFFSYQLNGVRKKDIAKVAQGVSIVHLHGNALSHLKVHYPSHLEQEKISSLLHLIDRRIATQSKVIEKYESLIKAINDSVISRLLKGRVVSFKDLYVEAGEGGTPSTSEHSYYKNGSIPFIKIDDLSDKYLTINKDFITELGVQKSSAWVVPENSIIYSNGATIGAISISTYPVCTKQGILGIVPTSDVRTEYLYYFMSSSYFNKQVQRIVTEGTMKTAYLKDINLIKCPLPTIDEQDKIAYGLSSISSKLELEKQLRNKLLSNKKYLLQVLFI